MRKHFLLLMLLTLLPLAGWAQIEVNVRAKVFEVEYGKANPLTVDPAMLRLSIDNDDLAEAIAAIEDGQFIHMTISETLTEDINVPLMDECQSFSLKFGNAQAQAVILFFIVAVISVLQAYFTQKREVQL